MDIEVYEVGGHDGYEVIRRTAETSPEWVYFIVQTRWGSKKLAAWAVNTSAKRRFSGFLHRLRALIPIVQLTIVDGPYGHEAILAQVMLSLDDAYKCACHYAESLAGVSSETSRLIDEHAVEIHARLLAQREVDEIVPMAETG